MSKKILAMLLSLILAFALTACGGDTAPAEDTGSEQEAAQTEQTEEPAEEPVEPAADEIVLADNESCTFKITGIDPDNSWGYTLKAYLENKTTDVTLMFAIQDAYVNGFQCDPFWASELAAGKKSNEEISFMSSDFETNGITDVEEIELHIKVYDSVNWDASPVVQEVVTITP